MTLEKPYNIEEINNDIGIELPYKVILFNDDIHSFDEVIIQIIKAIKCTAKKATEIAFEAHVKGKATVFSGELNACLKISSVLQEIALNTQIET